MVGILKKKERILRKMNENQNIKNSDRDTLEHWERLREKYSLMSESLERQLKETNILSPDWEETYSVLLDVREKLRDAAQRARRLRWLKCYDAFK